jgi:anti-sigma factor (TIGR02949 family)
MTDAEHLSCREVVELLTEYLEHALEPADLRRLEQHLDACGNCSRYLEQLRQTIRVTGTLRLEQLPSELEEALVGAFAGRR